MTLQVACQLRAPVLRQVQDPARLRAMLQVPRLVRAPVLRPVQVQVLFLAPVQVKTLHIQVTRHREAQVTNQVRRPALLLVPVLVHRQVRRHP